MTSNIVSTVVRETLASPSVTPVAVSTVVRETLYAPPPPPLLVAMVVRETLMPGIALVRTCIFE